MVAKSWKRLLVLVVVLLVGGCGSSATVEVPTNPDPMPTAGPDALPSAPPPKRDNEPPRSPPGSEAR